MAVARFDMTTPYTFAMHAQRCGAAAKSGQVLSGKHVQVRKYGVIYCARLLEAYTTPSGLDCWIVVSITPQAARFTVSCKNVTECGFGNCVCDSGPLVPFKGPSAAVSDLDVCADSGADFSGISAPGFSHGRVVAPRDSLNIEKTPVFAGV